MKTMTMDRRQPLISLKGGLRTARLSKLWATLKAEREAKLSKKKAGVPAQKKRKLTTNTLIKIQGRQ